MLHRMYVMWAEKNGYSVTELNRQDGDVAGIKSVELEIQGDHALRDVEKERTESIGWFASALQLPGKRMTSFSSVFVHPMIDNSIEVEVNPADLE